MSDSTFEFGQIDQIIEKVSKDNTGNLQEILGEVIRVSKKAAKNDVSLPELASIVSLGWYMGADPEIENTFNLLIMTAMGDQLN